MSVPSNRKTMSPKKTEHKIKHLYSPQPIKKRSEAESRLLFRPLQMDFSPLENTEKKIFYSLDAFTFETTINRAKSFHFIPTFSFLDDLCEIDNQKTFKDEEEKIVILDQIRKECSNPHYKDLFFINHMNENFLEENLEIDG